jgi:tRNA pseudouridine55 synthase
MQSVDKEYFASIRLGRATDTYDGEGSTVKECPVPEISQEWIDQLLEDFQGEVRQLPPMYSAVKVNGERLYKAARRGEMRERPARVVTIYELELLDREADTWEIRLRCSSGTYVRSLANDLGERLGCGAFLKRLRRTRSGEFDLSHSVPIDELEDCWQEKLIPISELMPHLPAVRVDACNAQGIMNGNPYRHSDPLQEEYCRLFYRDLLLAVGRVRDAVVQPEVVLRTRVG